MTIASDLEKRALPSTQGEDPARAALWALLAPHAGRLRLRRGQTVNLGVEGEETVFVPRSGALLLQLTLPATQRQIVGLLFPGDVLRSDFVPPQAGGALAAATPAELWRLRPSILTELSAREIRLRDFFQNALAVWFASAALHLAAIARFSGEQRVATVLIELALRTGMASPRGGVVLDMPFSRTDLADYVGLNPDTLSRIMSRLRSDGVLGPSERSRIILRDFPALAALTPASRSLSELYADRLGGAFDAAC